MFPALLMAWAAAFAPPGASQGFGLFDATDTAAVPKLLSHTGLYADIGAKTLGPGIHRYSVNVPQWNDGAVSERFIALPEGARVAFRADSAFGIPAGTALIQQLGFDSLPGDAATRRVHETRILVNRGGAAGWLGFSYAWDPDQSEARLVGPSGLTRDLGPPPAAGEARTWVYPARSACTNCHVPRGRPVLGFFQAQLNRPSPVAPGQNQLAHLVQSGLLQSPAGAFPDWNSLHRWHPLSDDGAGLDTRARSYLAANCSGCHGPEAYRAANIPAVHDLNYFRSDYPVNYLNLPGKFDYGISGSLLVYGGAPQKSIFILRIAVRGSQLQMPPSGTDRPDTAAIRVLSDWIRGLPAPGTSVIPPGKRRAGMPGSPEFAPAPGAGASRYDLTGRRMSMVPDAIGGLYLLRDEKGRYSKWSPEWAY